ncbi:MAG TPA: hypothetical protein VEX43_11855 [Chthoniobacterales bacterium]|nr:hypothetical protein [Chthoniobacterales bacterium]
MAVRAPFSAAFLAAFALICLAAEYGLAQSPLGTKWEESLVRLPVPAGPLTPDVTVSAAAQQAVAQRRPAATYIFGDGKRLTTRSRTGRFRLVGLRAGEVVDIALQLPARLPAGSAMAQPLDGGKLISFSRSDVDVGGLATIRFQAGSQPGLYRVFVPGFGAPSLIQFWVADPNNPRANPPVMNPQH